MRPLVLFFYIGLIVGASMLYTSDNERGEQKKEVVDASPGAFRVKTLEKKRLPRQPRNAHLRVGLPSKKVQPLYNSIEATLYAGAIGDAMGFAIERINAGVAPEGTVYPDGVRRVSDLQAGDWLVLDDKKYVPYSDDTAMVLDTFDSLMLSLEAKDTMDSAMQRLARTYVAGKNQADGWAVDRRFPGNACWNNVAIVERRIQQKAYFPAWWAAGGSDDGGCGSVMRAYPFGVLFKDEPEKAALWAAQHSKITHRAPIALAACAAMATGTAYALQGKTPDEMVKSMKEAAEVYDEQTAEVILTADRWSKNTAMEPGHVFRRFPGYAADDAIAAATYVFMKNQNSLYDGLCCAANMIGDSDSVASMAGVLIGARLGSTDQLPKDWRDNLEGRVRIEAIAKKVNKIITQSQESRDI